MNGDLARAHVFLARSALFLSAFGLSACRGDPTDPGAIPRIVTVSPATLQLVLGQTGQLSVSITDTAGAPLDTVPVEWTSDDPTVATIDPFGHVTALTLGSATITAQSEGFFDRATVTTGLAFTQLSAGDGHTCGVVPGGAAYCWGDGTRGQLGHGRLESDTRPVRVTGDAAFTTITAGRNHACGLVGGGDVLCWGEGARGQRGDGTTAVAAMPTPIESSERFASVRAGGDHTCAVSTDGAGFCWGSNASGQLGDGSLTGRQVPTAITGGVRWTQIDPGLDHTCGISTGGQAYCWGRNDEGQLGRGFSSGPVTAPGATVVIAAFGSIATGWDTYACGVLTTGRVPCWGRGDFGQLGTGTTVEADSTPAFADPAPALATIAVGTFHTCATTADARTFCWGTSRLGLPGVSESMVPLEIPIALETVTVGTLHTCGLASFGRAYCWGGNDRGQLGNGSIAPSEVPVPVALQLP